MSRKERRAITAWLGLFAFAIQVLIPLLLGAEITLAASGSDPQVFDLCSFHHVEAPPGGTGKADRQGERHYLCPICIALLASPAVTATAPPVLPLPEARPLLLERPAPSQAPPLAARLPYRSRAPPIG
jgi:hypothetical protein